MSLDVNGERKQTGSTSTMIFSIPFLLAYITAVHGAGAGRRGDDGNAAGRRLGEEAAAST